MDLGTRCIREQRQSLATQAHPQEGVNRLRAEFTGTAAIPGVVDVEDA